MIGIECDGEEFHDDWRDEWRDAMILGSGKVDTIYRFRGKDLYFALNDCIHMMYLMDKPIFSDRYPAIAERLISDRLKEMAEEGISENETIYLRYYNEEEILWKRIVIERRGKEFGHWKVLFKYSLDYPGKTIDQLIAIREGEMRNRKF